MTSTVDVVSTETVLPDLDVARLRKLRAHLAEYPEHHYQGAWFLSPCADSITSVPFVLGECGSTACAAGTVVYLDGWRPVSGYDGYKVTKDGQTKRVMPLAARLLGLSAHEASTMFLSTESTEDVIDMIDNLLSGRRMTESQASSAVEAFLMSGVTDDPADPRLTRGPDTKPREQAPVYLVLSDAELATRPSR